MRETSLDDFISEDGASEEGEPAEPDVPGGAGGAKPTSGDAEGAGTAADDADADTDRDAGADESANADGGDDGTPESTSPTFDWTPGGAACAACGERIERRWTDDGRLVCAACKEW